MLFGGRIYDINFDWVGPIYNCTKILTICYVLCVFVFKLMLNYKAKIVNLSKTHTEH